MTFKIGDKVSIVSAKSWFYGAKASVIEIDLNHVFPYRLRMEDGIKIRFGGDELALDRKFKKGDRVTAGHWYGGIWINLIVEGYYYDHDNLVKVRKEDGVEGGIPETELRLIVEDEPTEDLVETEEDPIQVVDDWVLLYLGGYFSINGFINGVPFMSIVDDIGVYSRDFTTTTGQTFLFGRQHLDNSVCPE